MLEEISTQLDRDHHEGSDQPGGVVGEESLLARQVAEFREERERWELHREQELERLRREGSLLAETWKRLESEERCLLAERELLNQRVVSRPGSNCAPTAPASSAQGTVGERSHSGGYDQDQMAWLQFQQLRREFQKYDRRPT